LQQAADQGFVQAQLACGILFRQGRLVERNAAVSAGYFKAAADQGSIEGALEYSNFLIRGDGIEKDIQESERYLRFGISKGDVRCQMRLGIYLISGVLGRFDFEEARKLFDCASHSNRFACVLRNSLNEFKSELVNSFEFLSQGNIFSILRSSSNESIGTIRLLTSHLNEIVKSECETFQVWKKSAEMCFKYLVDLSQMQSAKLRSFPSNLLSCISVRGMIGLLFRMYTIECSLYKNVNHFLRCFPVVLVSKFMGELNGILHYIYLLQSSIEYCSRIDPLTSKVVVYRGLKTGGLRLAPLYYSMIDEVIVWPSFTSTSKSRDVVIENFIEDEDSILFEIVLHPGDIACCIRDYSEYENESEILIAATTGFTIESVEEIEIEKRGANSQRRFQIFLVKLRYWSSWYDWNIDEPPERFLVEGNEMPDSEYGG
jgi:hypothetical protein